MKLKQGEEVYARNYIYSGNKRAWDQWSKCYYVGHTRNRELAVVEGEEGCVYEVNQVISVDQKSHRKSIIKRIQELIEENQISEEELTFNINIVSNESKAF